LPKSYRYSVEYPVPSRQDYDLAGELNTAPEAAARIRRILELIDRHVSTLVFVNSRTNAEMLGHKLGALSSKVAVHHGSISREERTAMEDWFKQRALKALICTSTLELGIDIGHIDFAVQYLSPRRVSSLIQRVGRSGHKLDKVSEGTIITAFPDDALEAIATVRLASKNMLEPVRIHENALDVLAHQIAGILMDKSEVKVDEAYQIVRRAYPYRNLSKAKFFEVVKYLNALRELWLDGDFLRKTGNTRRYYYSNLSMIPDERRYPFLCKGKVWRIVQIEDETGTVYVIPSEDPLAAALGWDGEMLPLPLSIAKETGKLRHQLAEELKRFGEPRKAAERVAESLSVELQVLLDAANEIHEQISRGLPVPTDNLILVEAFDKYFIIHSLGCILDAILSDHELMTGWWNDGYRILVEVPREVNPQDLERLPSLLFDLTDENVDKAFDEFLEARFPFAERMKFIAERFGALPRGRMAGPRLLSQIAARFKNTPIYEETLREIMTEKVDLQAVKKIMADIKAGKITVKTLFSREDPSPIAYHILAKYADIPELMAPRRVLLSNIERMKRSIEARNVSKTCFVDD